MQRPDDFLTILSMKRQRCMVRVVAIPYIIDVQTYIFLLELRRNKDIEPFDRHLGSLILQYTVTVRFGVVSRPYLFRRKLRRRPPLYPRSITGMDPP